MFEENSIVTFFEYVHRKSMLEEKQRYPSSKMCSNKRTICVYKTIATVAKSLALKIH
jgi:hypothetical protein